MTLKASKLGPRRSRHISLKTKPALYEMLEHKASSKVAIEEESMIKASQDIMHDKHKTLLECFKQRLQEQLQPP